MPKRTRVSAAASLIIALAACGNQAAPTPASTTLTVFAAASLAETFTELGKDFEAGHPGVTVVFNFAGSQQLAQQLGQGAPADVFASANTKQMDAAVESGRVVRGTPKVFARNRLAVIFPNDNPAKLHNLNDLAKPGLRVVLAAQEVPAGQYASDFLDKAAQSADFGSAFRDGVLKNVMSYEENVRAVLSKVELGEADAGIVYISDIGAGKVGRIEIPDAFNTIASYPIAPIGDGRSASLAQQFIDMALGPSGQAVLVKYGFIAAP